MADTKKSKRPSNNNIEHLKTDIASFASSLGLSTSLPPSNSSGFNDVDFRNPKKPQQKPKPAPNQKPSKPQNRNTQNFNPQNRNTQNFNPQNRNTQKFKPNERPNFLKPNPKPHVPSLPDIYNNSEKARNFDNLPKLPLITASNMGVWYEEAEELEGKVLGKKTKTAEATNEDEWKGLVANKRKLGERLMAQYTADYESSKGKSGDIKLLITTQRSGTASDKISAFSVLVGDDPIANLRSLDALLGMVASKVGKRYAFAGFDALRELFLSSLLPDRKLKSLSPRPLNHLPETKDGYSLLLLWYWEECLKQRYERFVFALEEASRDMLPELKNKALKTIYVLLKSKSEQERRLLSALVNKLGDPKNKGASDADFHLSNLLRDHPNMKAVVIDEVDSFLFRPHLSIQAKYHAVNFLSQIQLRNKGDGPKVAKSLVDIYFALFKVLISEAAGGEKTDKSEKVGGKKPPGSLKDGKGNSSSDSHVELDSRLLSALLMGVNRAFPYVSRNEADDVIEVQTPMLFHLVHSVNFNVGVQALMLLHHISSKNQIVSDRFYRALYSKLLLPAAMNTSKAETFIGLLLRAIKSDVNLKRTAAFAKRLLQVALQQPPQYACGCLFLLSEVLKARPPLWNMMLQDESVDDDLEHFEDVIEETDNEPSPVSEEKDIELVHNSDTANSDHDSSEDDIDSPASYSEDEASDEADEFLFRNDSKESKMVPDSSVQQPQVVSSEKSALPGGYDPRHREPSYCNADCVSWWELTVLASHVHPSVSTMAKTLLSGANIVYNGNPLNDLSLTAFLDKFMEKKPKASTWHGGSQIEPAKKLDMTNRFIGPEILSLAEEDVPAEDLVFHKFYMNKMNTSKKPKKKKKKKATTGDEDAAELFDVDGGGGDDDSDNDEIDNMLDSAGVAMDADGDYDYDDLDQVANEDDENLLGNVSDVDLDLPSDIAEGEDFDATANSDESDDGDDAIDIGDADEEDEEVLMESAPEKSKRKRSKAATSPFASLEEYEHLFNEDGPAEKESTSKKKPKLRKKRKSSD